MADTNGSDSQCSTPKYSAPKDKNCPFCGQAFTSSSLGRHLDLYIKEKNPKPADGIHDVTEIKKLRGGITRRQARSSIGPKREVSTPASTPRPSASIHDSSTHVASSNASPALGPQDASYTNNTSSIGKNLQATSQWATEAAAESDSARRSTIDSRQDKQTSEGSQEPSRKTSSQRIVSKQVLQKAHLDAKHKLSDALDTAKAAELALKELLCSWRAATQHFSDKKSTPFDFDPYSLDFPALTLQCLQPPPTLFSSTQHSTPTSWSTQAPGMREFEALKGYFHEEFRKWRITTVSQANSEINDELRQYTANVGQFSDSYSASLKLKETADVLEKQMFEHLLSAFNAWGSLTAQRRHELWVLELARSSGRKQKEIDKLREDQQKLTEENMKLRAHLEYMNRLQQGREAKLPSPTSGPLDRSFVAHILEQKVSGSIGGLGFSLQNPQNDINSAVLASIDRWKAVVSECRASKTGMVAQKPLERSSTDGAASAPQANTNHTSRSNTAQASPDPHSNASSTSRSESQTALTSTAPPSIDEPSDADAEVDADADGDADEDEDADGDAEMEDEESYPVVSSISPVKHMTAPSRQATLEVPRTRGGGAPLQQRGRMAPAQARFILPNNMGKSAISMSRSMPNLNAAMQVNGMSTGMTTTDMGLSIGGGDPMYMD